MNTYARIRKIEEPDAFKRFFNTLMGATYRGQFEPTKEWSDFGLDGYLKNKKIAYAVYCPKYPERKSQQQYKNKVGSDIAKLAKALDEKKISFQIKEWDFVTPDDLSVKVKDFIKESAEKRNWLWGTLTAQNLAPLFMDHKEIHKDFPEITAGIQYDKVPSVYVKHVKYGNRRALKVFNNGTEAIQDLEAEINEPWRSVSHQFLYDFDDASRSPQHTCFTLKQGERQYIDSVPLYGGFDYRISGVGVESGKTFNHEGHIERIEDK